jgi:alkanesulfonate monooxygenase SsuD/methylene tetrahydromethanopterin reductase-like flavin-dependent oxidoreductase (luciferase family)
MIKRFHVLYVGQIDLDNVGLQGTPANDRRYSNERLSEVFFTTRDMARVMDDLGYYALWTAEHHFQHEGYECLPNLVQLGLWLATQTRRLKFGCAFNVLPMWHPIRLAEDYAMADIVTDGRVIMGVGRGYHTREVESFGAPLIDADKNREYFEEQLQLLLTSSTRSGSTSRASISRRRPRWSIAATSSRTSPWCRGRSTCRWRSGCRSPRARPST